MTGNTMAVPVRIEGTTSCCRQSRTVATIPCLSGVNYFFARFGCCRGDAQLGQGSTRRRFHSSRATDQERARLLQLIARMAAAGRCVRNWVGLALMGGLPAFNMVGTQAPCSAARAARDQAGVGAGEREGGTRDM